MEHSFKEHKKEVTSLRISAGDDTAVSASADGSCLVWSLRRATRVNALFAPTVFRAVMFHPDEVRALPLPCGCSLLPLCPSFRCCWPCVCLWGVCLRVSAGEPVQHVCPPPPLPLTLQSQLLTAGSDRKITYWDAIDCTAIRVMEGSTEEVRWDALPPPGALLPRRAPLPSRTSRSRPSTRSGPGHSLRRAAQTGSSRCAPPPQAPFRRPALLPTTLRRPSVAQVWRYDEGEVVATGTGHSGPVTKVRVAPDSAILLSAGEEGAVFIWRMPAL